MLKLFGCFYTPVRSTLLVLAVLQVAACGSPEDRAQSYYEHGMQLFAEHHNTKAAIELRNAVRLKKDLIGAWKTLAEIDETSRNWPGLVADLRTIVELAPTDVAARLKLSATRATSSRPSIFIRTPRSPAPLRASL